MRVVVMKFYLIFYDVEGCPVAISVGNKDGYSVRCNDSDGVVGGFICYFC